MSHDIRQKILYGAVFFLFLANGLVWFLVFDHQKREGIVTIAFLNIGQGDAIFIQAPNGNQMMIDGGPGKIVLSELNKVMPFYDRSIDLLLVTNPDTDHISGFIDVLKRYEVKTIVLPGTDSPTGTYLELRKKIQEENVKKVIAERSMEIMLSEEVSFLIFFPDRDASLLDKNQGSIVGKLSFGRTSVFFTGDSTKNIEKYLIELDSSSLNSDILKVGHHGSKTSTSEELIEAVSPEYAVISAGKKNKYGHPHKETLDVLNSRKVKILGTYDAGRIVFSSDGMKWKLEQ